MFSVRFSLQPLALLLVLGVSISGLSACSSDSSSNATNTSTLSAAPTGTANTSNRSTSNQAESNVVRIGYQKYGTLFLLKARGDLDQRLKEQGISVQWVQFPAGPPLLEALNAGSIDYGSTGETPPIFAQAAGTPLVYVAHEPPDPKGEAILVAKDSPLQKVADLKGKKVAFNKGSNVHYLLIRALAEAGLKYSDIQPVYLAPADARAAFEQGNVDAWVIWEPYLTVAKKALDARVLQDGSDLVANRQFYLASQQFTEQHPDRLQAIIEETQKVNEWTQSNFTQAAALLSPQIGIDPPTLTEILKERPYGVQQPLKPDVVNYQQQVADAFVELKLLPKPIKVQEVAQSQP
ncbi:sulfonate ABC transporter substrate-binding protein [Trichocoleus sp. FACHB-262]|uniref:sulfonate ABC transporter substrate-binding protein n=1 Tax=Trichocoleus sp. FACHB-262 TaxID=2692869 RepID=UPI0028C4D9AB|nr:sulfonate ABC transporter substrate-binding protein [Trichocoleus sp. FACHB-262]